MRVCSSINIRCVQRATRAITPGSSNDNAPRPTASRAAAFTSLKIAMAKNPASRCRGAGCGAVIAAASSQLFGRTSSIGSTTRACRLRMEIATLCIMNPTDFRDWASSSQRTDEEAFFAELIVEKALESWRSKHQVYPLYRHDFDFWKRRRLNPAHRTTLTEEDLERTMEVLPATKHLWLGNM